MESKFSARIAELPGPVWVFGAYVVSRMGEWAFGLLMQFVSGSWRLGGGTALMFLIPAAGVALPSACCGAWSAGAPTGCRWRAGMPGCVWCCISLRCSCCSFPDTIRICTEVPKCLSGALPECRIWCLVVPLPALSGALPCAGCRDVRGALRPCLCGALP